MIWIGFAPTGCPRPGCDSWPRFLLQAWQDHEFRFIIFMVSRTKSGVDFFALNPLAGGNYSAKTPLHKEEPNMSVAKPDHCAECGCELPPGLPPGLCPQCALREGSSGAASLDDSTGPGSIGPFPRAFGDYELLEDRRVLFLAGITGPDASLN